MNQAWEKKAIQPAGEPPAKKPDSGRFQRPAGSFFPDRSHAAPKDRPVTPTPGSARHAAFAPPKPPLQTRPDTARRVEAERDENRTLFPIKNENDIVTGGTATWKMCIEFGFSTLEAMQVRTAFSELARNILKYAVEGEVIVRRIHDDGIRLTFVDNGPGIEDHDKAMQYGFSSSGSLGLGLPGSKKLADRFELLSTPGKGTQITFEKFPKTKTPRKTEAILRKRLIDDRAKPPGFRPR